MDREKWDWKGWDRGKLTINGGAGNKGQGIFISASGYNNNDMFIIPEWDMVIVRLGLDQSDFHITDKIYNTFLQKVGKTF